MSYHRIILLAIIKDIAVVCGSRDSSVVRAPDL